MLLGVKCFYSNKKIKGKLFDLTFCLFKIYALFKFTNFKK